MAAPPEARETPAPAAPAPAAAATLLTGTDALRQDDLAAALRRRNARIIERAEAIPSRFTAETLRRRPAPGAWSPAEVLEHLCRSDEGYLVPMRRLIHEARSEGRTRGLRDRRWRPTLMGRLLVWALAAKRPVTTVAALEPRDGGARGQESLHTFIELRREFDRLLEAGADLPWRRLRFTSPYAGFVRPNLGDAFLVLVTHAERHLDQIEARSAAGGPA